VNLNDNSNGVFSFSSVLSQNKLMDLSYSGNVSYVPIKYGENLQILEDR